MLANQSTHQSSSSKKVPRVEPRTNVFLNQLTFGKDFQYHFDSSDHFTIKRAKNLFSMELGVIDGLDFLGVSSTTIDCKVDMK